MSGIETNTTNTRNSAPATAGASRSGTSGWLQRLFDRLRDFAERGWSGTAVFTYGVLQNFVVPGLADALFLPLALAQPKRAYRLAFAALAGTLVGATLLFWFGERALGLLADSLGGWTGVSAEGLARVESLLAQYGWLLVLGSTFSPLSTKLLALSAGTFGMPYAVFIGALGAGRMTRVLLFAWAIRRFGARAVREALGLRAEPDADEPAAAEPAAVEPAPEDIR